MVMFLEKLEKYKRDFKDFADSHNKYTYLKHASGGFINFLSLLIGDIMAILKEENYEEYEKFTKGNLINIFYRIMLNKDNRYYLMKLAEIEGFYKDLGHYLDVAILAMKNNHMELRGGSTSDDVGDYGTTAITAATAAIEKIPEVGKVLKFVNDNAVPAIDAAFGIHENPEGLQTYGLSDEEKQAQFFHDDDLIDPKTNPVIKEQNIKPIDQLLYKYNYQYFKKGPVSGKDYKKKYAMFLSTLTPELLKYWLSPQGQYAQNVLVHLHGH